MAEGEQRDDSVELALLKKRFPTRPVEKCGRHLSDFFCARTSGGCWYEGRLFVTQGAFFFVATHSSEYDVYIQQHDIKQNTILSREFLPVLSISLHRHQELFTNFHNLDGLIDLLPPPIIKVDPPVVKPMKIIRRMASVPAAPTPRHVAVTPPNSPNHPTVCPFYIRSGFCPRRSHCKLQHVLQPSLTPFSSKSSSSATNLTSSRTKISTAKSKISPTLISSSGPAKKFHKMTKENGENASTSEDALTTVPMETVSTATGVSVATGPTDEVTDYRRSVSLPEARVRGVAYGASTSIMARHDGDCPKPSRTDPMTSSQLSQGLGGNERGSVSGIEKDDKEEEEEEEEEVVVKSKPGVVSRGVMRTKVQEKVEVEEGEGKDEKSVVAELAQQLQLDSDSDSIHGDLDVDTQLKILESFSSSSSDQRSGPSNRLMGQQSSFPDQIPGPSSRRMGQQLLFSDQRPGPSNQSTGQQSSSQVRRRPCVYFLSGFCRHGNSCADYHGTDFDPSELDDEIDPFEMGGQEPAGLPKKVKVYHTDHAHISSGDKIVLSPEVLVACEQQKLSYPVAFQLTHSVSGESVYCGVLQFTAPSRNTAYLPPWLMHHLHASDGDVVDFAHVELPKGTFVRLQPVSSAWLGIPYDQRMAMMEFQLRNFQTLTEGSKITLTYELNQYTLKVLQCKPAKGISILNADITTDITEPADLSRYHSVVEGQAEHTGLGETVSCSTNTGDYRHFVLLSLPGKPLPPNLRVEVKAASGDPDLFLCQSCTAPSQSRYTWCCQEVGDCVVNLSTEDKEYDTGKPLYAGIVSLCEPTEFIISYNIHHSSTTLTNPSRGVVMESPMATTTGKTLRDSTHFPDTTTSTASSTTMPSSSSSSYSPSLATAAKEEEETDGVRSAEMVTEEKGLEKCPTCGSVMASLKLVMHQRHCALSTFICSDCKAVLPKTAERKHKYIAHSLLVCACGLEFTQLALHHHQKTDCYKRMVQCQFKWCNLSFPSDQLIEHESLCGRKKISCCLCQEEVSQLEMSIHLEAFHSIDTRDLDWSKPLRKEDLEARVVKPQLSCKCGVGFDFQDDMEVHQLTDCPLRRLTEHQSTSNNQGEIVG